MNTGYNSLEIDINNIVNLSPGDKLRIKEKVKRHKKRLFKYLRDSRSIYSQLIDSWRKEQNDNSIFSLRCFSSCNAVGKKDIMIERYQRELLNLDILEETETNKFKEILDLLDFDENQRIHYERQALIHSNEGLTLTSTA